MNNNSTQQGRWQQVTLKDLVEELKKRVVFLAICVVGLAYLMSLTSSAVWINLPAAASIIIILRYLSVDYEMRRKAVIYNSKPPPAIRHPQQRPDDHFRAVENFKWRRKVNSPVVEGAIDHFTRHLVSEWVTDLWYSRLTPDKEGPEELVHIINGVFGEFSIRMKDINLIDLLTRDLINLICAHLELFRTSQAKIESKQLGPLTVEHRDMELRRVLASENKLHPALFSAEAEHKVLQHMLNGLVSFTFRHEDLKCCYFRITVREILATAVLKPVLNLVTPRFINERIESFVVSRKKVKEQVVKGLESSNSELNESAISADHFSGSLDPSVSGVELVKLKKDQNKNPAETHAADDMDEALASKDPLLSMDTRSSHYWSSLPSDSSVGAGLGIQCHSSGGEWGNMLDLMSQRRTQALAPEHLENMWAKGRNYRETDDQNRIIEQLPQNSFRKPVTVSSNPKVHANSIKSDNRAHSIIRSAHNDKSNKEIKSHLIDQNKMNHASLNSYWEEHDEEPILTEEEGSDSSYSSEDGDTSNVTGLDSPGTKVWDGRTKKDKAGSHIHHPLESIEGQHKKKAKKRNAQFKRMRSGTKKPSPSNYNPRVWQEVERTSFLSGGGQDILTALKGDSNLEDTSDDSDAENYRRIENAATASSSSSYMSIPESYSCTVNSQQSSFLVDSFFKLKCEVLGANIVKSGSKPFAVYSISVTDVNNKSWSIKRRYRHFEELHGRLKVFPEYNLHLPPKHFLSTGLEASMIQERCILLDGYLKKLLQLPRVSGSIELWDFLSVDSQTYIFSNSFSIIQTLSVNSHRPSPINQEVLKYAGPIYSGKRFPESRDSASTVTDGSRVNSKNPVQPQVESPGKDCIRFFKDSNSDSDATGTKNELHAKDLNKLKKEKQNGVLTETSKLLDASIDPTFPSEWIPPNLSMPILGLVDVILQLKDGGWIRRKAFWLAKQILQLGMGDAFDDWLLEKIQLLRKGYVIASGIKKVEEILWPDGIFITKHPKRREPSPSTNSPHPQHPPEASSPGMNDEEQQREAERRANLVYELMIDKAPAAIVSLVGHKEYEHCAKDLYYFIQSSVCLKQLAFDILELLLLSTFPELDHILKKLQDEKDLFDNNFYLAMYAYQMSAMTYNVQINATGSVEIPATSFQMKNVHKQLLFVHGALLSIRQSFRCYTSTDSLVYR